MNKHSLRIPTLNYLIENLLNKFAYPTQGDSWEKKITPQIPEAVEKVVK